MVVGSLLSYWEGNFSGAMLNFAEVDPPNSNSNRSSPIFVETSKTKTKQKKQEGSEAFFFPVVFLNTSIFRNCV